MFLGAAISQLKPYSRSRTRLGCLASLPIVNSECDKRVGSLVALVLSSASAKFSQFDIMIGTWRATARNKSRGEES